MNNLGNELGLLCGRRGDLEEAITTARRVVNLTSVDHPKLAMYLNNLATKLESRYEWTGEMADLEEAMTTARLAGRLNTGRQRRSGDVPDQPRQQ